MCVCLVFLYAQTKTKTFRLGKKKRRKERKKRTKEYTIEDEQYTQECLCVSLVLFLTTS